MPNLNFWDKKQIDSNGCWIWTGCKDKDGYGVAWYNKRKTPAHRAAYMIYHKITLDKETFVCHKCDNPPCINPAHLFAGSHKDNMQDKLKKGHHKSAFIGLSWPGSKNGNSSLTEEQVREIRAKYTGKRGQRNDLAVEYKVSPRTIEFVVKRKTWRHI